MITRTELLTYLNTYLDSSRFQDYAPNGLQVEGRDRIATICTAVTASESVIEKACQLGADTLLVHHGYFWKGEDPVVCGMKRRRLKLLLTHDMNLIAYHLPLDCHPQIGNNACLAEKWDVVDVETQRHGQTADLLWKGRLKQPMTPDALQSKVEQTLGRTPMHIACDKPMIETIAWCSGAAQDLIEAAAAWGVDAYLSGEISERTYYQAKELSLHYFACGHHATERYGIQTLGAQLNVTFGVRHIFIDSDNPV